mmetsp:Transcript_43347/g.69692  ORF Transcript_43347/g.69692 Transcript_43347/m.69692 type:complete len:89 (+) Transcript_43347:233-499(+)
MRNQGHCTTSTSLTLVVFDVISLQTIQLAAWPNGLCVVFELSCCQLPAATRKRNQKHSSLQQTHSHTTTRPTSKITCTCCSGQYVFNT